MNDNNELEFEDVTDAPNGDMDSFDDIIDDDLEPLPHEPEPHLRHAFIPPRNGVHYSPIQVKSNHHDALPLEWSHLPENQMLRNLMEGHAIVYHPDKGFHINEANLAHLVKSENTGNLKLVHFSHQPNLKTIHPDHMGTGAPSEENKRGVPEIKRSYFYRADSEPESIVTDRAHSKYHATLDLAHQRLYDLSNDHEGHIKQALSENQGAWNSDKILGKVRAAGYHGFYNSGSSLPNVVALFHPTQVEHEEMINKK